MKLMGRVHRYKHGKGERITVLNNNGTVGAVIYIDKNGNVHCDSWINYNQTNKKKFDKAMYDDPKPRKFDPSYRECKGLIL